MTLYYLLFTGSVLWVESSVQTARDQLDLSSQRIFRTNYVVSHRTRLIIYSLTKVTRIELDPNTWYLTGDEYCVVYRRT